MGNLSFKLALLMVLVLAASCFAHAIHYNGHTCNEVADQCATLWCKSCSGHAYCDFKMQQCFCRRSELSPQIALPC
ncbi:hypothetical protein Tsubulata_039100 [Turnera subulata]|uniref:Uncharacterized protein n=1 Tax=Turnera subulata TaxID=218843 RepID=A0A9Q0FAJ0_9ROSI|nr:hypothetical protein Tsubulata_042291 [Turnera subulata]KAJ4845035.1 hypothetical protein Tsubulata_039097 [Turnera subulata]KAJ4845036.1 hypothetical protein Tsubulata_039100 [Turnera subulata]